MKNLSTAKRDGATLLELLVVIGIMLALAALSAAILPALRQKNNSAKAAAQVQGFLSISKQQSIRDRAPRGIRLIPDPTNPALIRSLQYIEVPEPTRFAPLPNGTVQPFVTINQVAAMDYDNYRISVQSVASTSTWDIVGAQAGDYFVVSKSGSTYFFELISLGGSAGNPTADVKARSGLQGLFPPPMMMGSPLSATESDFLIVRRARPLVGEQAIQLPPNMSIDLNYCAVSSPVFDMSGNVITKYAQLSTPICLNSGYEAGVPQYDILFSADGEMLGTVTDKFILCVKPDDGASGEPTLIVIYARTGAIMLQPVAGTLPATVTAPSAAFDSLFFFTEDGAGSGL